MKAFAYVARKTIQCVHYLARLVYLYCELADKYLCVYGDKWLGNPDTVSRMPRLPVPRHQQSRLHRIALSFPNAIEGCNLYESWGFDWRGQFFYYYWLPCSSNESCAAKFGDREYQGMVFFKRNGIPRSCLRADQRAAMPKSDVDAEVFFRDDMDWAVSQDGALPAARSGASDAWPSSPADAWLDVGVH